MPRARGLLVVLMLLAGCSQSAEGDGPAEGGSSVDAIRVSEITYARWSDIEPLPPEARPLGQDDLGPQVGEISRRVVDEGDRVGHLEATGLEAGTPVYEVKGYERSFRLAAPHPGGGLALYEPWSNPRAQTVADLLQLDGKVRSIGIYTREPPIRRLGSIDDPGQVQRLVDLLLAAPVPMPARAFGDGETATVGFLLRDGTAVTRTVNLDNGVMNGGIPLPDEVVRAVKGARR